MQSLGYVALCSSTGVRVGVQTLGDPRAHREGGVSEGEKGHERDGEREIARTCVCVCVCVRVWVGGWVCVGVCV